MSIGRGRGEGSTRATRSRYLVPLLLGLGVLTTARAAEGLERVRTLPSARPGAPSAPALELRSPFPAPPESRWLERFKTALGRSTPRPDDAQRIEPRRIERGFRRAARETMKSFLVDRDEGARDAFRTSSSGPQIGRVRFRLGVSRLVPRVELRSSIGRGALGVSVAADGRVVADLSGAVPSAPRVRLGFDLARRSCDLAARFSF